MYCFNAASELRFSFWQGLVPNGGASCLFGPENRPDKFGSSNSFIRHHLASEASSQGNPHRKLDVIIPATKMDSRLLFPIAALLQRFEGLEIENLLVLLCDQSGRLIKELRVSSGSNGKLTARFRPIISVALAFGARKLLLAHNHPSGCPEPSETDIQFTRNLIKICAPLEILVVDHLVIAGAHSISMRELNLL